MDSVDLYKGQNTLLFSRPRVILQKRKQMDSIISKHNILNKDNLYSTEDILKIACEKAKESMESVLEEFPNFPENVPWGNPDEPYSDDIISYCQFKANLRNSGLIEKFKKVEGIDLFLLWNFFENEFKKEIIILSQEIWYDHLESRNLKSVCSLP